MDMVSNTKAFEILKKQQQEIIDFGILIAHAIPSLEKIIHAHECKIDKFEKMPKPDYFQLIDITRLKGIKKEYKYNLCKYLMLSIFSFFENYFRSVVEELIEFQDGEQSFIDNSQTRIAEILNKKDLVVYDLKKKLQEPYDNGKTKFYKKKIEDLKSMNYRFPSDLFSTFGIKYLTELVGSSKFHSYMIPSILKDGFHLNLEELPNSHVDLKDMNFEQTFDSLRSVRNSIAHGEYINIDINKVMEYNDFLRKFAIKIDKHLLTHFFVIEKIKI